MLKSYRVMGGVVVVANVILVSAQVLFPFGLDFGTLDFGNLD